MVDLARWLGTQLDEDERIARAACWDEQSDVWTARPPQKSYERYTVVDYCDDGVVAVTPENADADGVGRHVEAWDPARVLREINAKRKLLRRANGGVDYPHTHPGEDDADHLARHHDDELLRLLALPYADRPGYAEAIASL